jgi:hypothetical protein
MTFLITLTLLTAAPSFDTPSPAPAQVDATGSEVHRAWGLSVLGGAVGVAGWIASVAVYSGSTQCDEGPQGEATQVALRALGYQPCSPRASALTLLPLLGPWIALSDPATPHAGLTAATAAVGVAQLAALAMCILGPLIHIDPSSRLSFSATPTGIAGTFW